MRRHVRAAAALFGLVTGIIGLAQLGASLVAAGSYVLALVPLILLSATTSGLLALGSGAVLVRGDRAALGARVAGVLLAGTALGYIALVVVTSPNATAGAAVPAVAAAILLLASRDRSGGATRQRVTGPARVGQLVLVVVAAGALAWSAIALAGMTAGGTTSGLIAYAGVRAGIAVATLHAALAAVALRFPAVALLAAGALDVALGAAGAAGVVGQSAAELGALALAGILLAVLGAAARLEDGAAARGATNDAGR